MCQIGIGSTCANDNMIFVICDDVIIYDITVYYKLQYNIQVAQP